MAINISHERLRFLGNHHQYDWNKKLCFQARDTFFDCVDATENGNKYRCPDQLYAYEMWCPPDFRRIHSMEKSKEKIDKEMYDPEWVQKVNSDKQTIKHGHYFHK